MSTIAQPSGFGFGTFQMMQVPSLEQIYASMTPEEYAKEMSMVQRGLNGLFGNPTLEGIQSNFRTMLADPTTANSVINSHIPYLGGQTAHDNVIQGIDEFSQYKDTLAALSAGLQAQGYAANVLTSHLGGGEYLPNGHGLG